MEKPTPSGDAAASLPRQAVVYRRYLRLQAIAAQRFSSELAGRLVLSVGFDLHGAELALATTIAGGVFLGIEASPEKLKAAVRNGSCDFMVNTLDESLRVLKNELRKHTPLSAGLLGDADTILAEMVERGVQPDLIAESPLEIAESPLERVQSALRTLAQRGAEVLPPPGVDPAPHQVVWTAANPHDLRRIDRSALESIPLEDIVRHRWLQQAPGNFYRQTPLAGVVDLEPDELAHLREALETDSAIRPFQAPATLCWKDSAGVEQTITL